MKRRPVLLLTLPLFSQYFVSPINFEAIENNSQKVISFIQEYGKNGSFMRVILFVFISISF